MSAPNLPDILARLAAATPGPWHRMTVPDGDPIDGPTGEDYVTNCIGAMDSDHNETFIADAETDADATLIAHAPRDLTALVTRVAELEADLATRRAYCMSCESWVRAVDEDRCCRTCGEDVVVVADQMSLELVRDHASTLAARVAELEAENAAQRATLADPRVADALAEIRADEDAAVGHITESPHRAALVARLTEIADGQPHPWADGTDFELYDMGLDCGGPDVIKATPSAARVLARLTAATEATP